MVEDSKTHELLSISINYDLFIHDNGYTYFWYL